MPWENDGDGIRFSGHLTDLITLIMSAYDQDAEAGVIVASPGVYVTATAIVLREIVLETLADQPEAEEFVQRVSDALEEGEDGTVTIATFPLLDDIAEHFEAVAYEAWIANPATRSAVAELTSSVFAE